MIRVTTSLNRLLSCPVTQPTHTLTCLQFLVNNAGVQVDATALRLASQYGHAAAVRACLVALGPAASQVVNEPDSASYSALHYASFGGHGECLHVLIQVSNGLFCF